MISSNIEEVRRNFPALQQSQVYFDNAGGSQALGAVIKSIDAYLSQTNVQLGASYNASQESTLKYYRGYKAAAEFINAPPENIVLGPSATQIFRNLSYALRFPEGSELIISSIDHECNIAPWIDLARRQNLVVRWWTPKSKQYPELRASDLKQLLTSKTALVTCTHVSNILGTIHNIKAIADAVHEIPNALVCVDGVAYAPHRQLDMEAFGVDFYSFSWYKMFGPHIALLYASVQGLNAVNSLNHFFNPSSTLENKLGLAGSSYELVASIPAVLDYFGPEPSKTWEIIEKHEFELQKTLLDYLNFRSDITICGEKDPTTQKRVCTISFLAKGRSSQEIVEKINKISHGTMGIQWGGFYSIRLVKDLLDLGQDGVIRVSMVHYNTVAEVKKLIGMLEKVLENFESSSKYLQIKSHI